MSMRGGSDAPALVRAAAGGIGRRIAAAGGERTVKVDGGDDRFFKRKLFAGTGDAARLLHRAAQHLAFDASGDGGAGRVLERGDFPTRANDRLEWATGGQMWVTSKV